MFEMLMAELLLLPKQQQNTQKEELIQTRRAELHLSFQRKFTSFL